MTDPYAFPPEDDAPAPASLDELNEPQARAASHVDGPLLIFAGAGSGKTRVIVYRIANLVAVHRVPPYRILAVTFTNKAAGEMKSRLGSLLGEDVTKDLWVGTFHAVCVKLLRRYHEAAGLGRSFVIYDDSDQRTVMNRVIKALELDDKRFPPRQVLSRIHHAKQEGKGPEHFEHETFVGPVLKRCFEEYQRHLKEANAVDFDDILLAVLRLVEDPESLPGREICGRFWYVLVDEFQDVNQVQYRLVKAFAGERKNLCVVGDDDQSIYKWRGADVRIVRGFRRDFPGAEVVKLEQNYRSTGHIVKGALGVIKPAGDREPKELWTDNPEGDPISVVAADNEHDEAAFVAKQIKEVTGKGISPRQIAVFYRIHAQSRVLEEVMLQEKIPYQIIGGMRFFERAEVKNLLAYLRVVDNPKSDVDLMRIINVPARKIGDTTLERLVAAADEGGCSIFEALGPAAAEGGAMGTAARNAVLGFRDLLQGLMRVKGELSPSELADQVLEKSGYVEMLQADESAEAETRLQNLRELVGSILGYEEEAAAAGEEASLSGYLEKVTLQSDADTLEEKPRVAMMTVHAAKGLEFDTVFLTGMEEELFPFQSMDGKRGDEQEEERRLAYVAVTRARRKLWVTYAGRRAIFGTTRFGIASRFLRDLPAGSVRQEMTPALALQKRGRGSYVGDDGGFGARNRPRAPWVHPQERAMQELRAAAAQRAPGERYVEREDDGGGGGGAEGAFAVGARVTHDRFGIGVVQAASGGVDPTVTVKFSGYTPKSIKARFLRLAGR